MKINSVKIHNILSIEDASLNFGDSGLVLVEGYDYDTGRANGAGKSTIFNAISFALFDKIPRRITKSEILRNGTKSGYVEVEVQVGSRKFMVIRERPTKVQYLIDGLVVEITQEEFELQIGMNYEQFLITMYTAQDSANKFIDLNDAGKKNFILKIMNLNFTKYKDETALEILKLEQDQDLIKSKLEQYKSNIEIYKFNMLDSTDIDCKIQNCNQVIDLAKVEIKKLELIKEPDISKYLDAEAKIQNKLIEIKSTRLLCNIKRVELDKLKNTTPDTFCPECDADLNIVDGQAVKSDDSSRIQEQIQAVTSQINDYEKDTCRESEIIDLFSKIQHKKQVEYREFHEANSAISTYKNSINIESVMIKEFNEKLDKSNDIKLKVVQIVNDTRTLQTRLKNAEQELVILKLVDNIFDTTGAPAYIMDYIIDSFNDSVTDYINEIWPNASYSLQTYKYNKDKSIKAKFSESLTINGKQRSLGSLSGGEIRALSLALDFSIIEVLGSKYSMSLNPVILDEPFNGLDSAGREMVIDILTKFSANRQVWVIDHASESKALFNDIVRVEKRNGISKIV